MFTITTIVTITEKVYVDCFFLQKNCFFAEKKRKVYVGKRNMILLFPRKIHHRYSTNCFENKESFGHGNY